MQQVVCEPAGIRRLLRRARPQQQGTPPENYRIPLRGFWFQWPIHAQSASPLNLSIRQGERHDS